MEKKGSGEANESKLDTCELASWDWIIKKAVNTIDWFNAQEEARSERGEKMCCSSEIKEMFMQIIALQFLFLYKGETELIFLLLSFEGEEDLHGDRLA